MRSPVVLRDYVPDDAPAALELITSVLGEYGFAPDVGGLRRDLELAGERYGGARAGFWVAESGGALVGTVAVRAKDDATCELKRLYVHPGARRRGVGHALYERAESFARAAGYARIWLDSSRRFTQARRLYEQRGFVLVEELDNDWEDNVYEKSLAP